MKKPYQIVSSAQKTAAAAIEQFARTNGQFLLPLVELITEARAAVDEVICAVGRKTVETIFLLSAQQVAGEQTPGKASGEIRWHGSQTGRVALADRGLQVKRPRLRHKTEGEVKVPAYESLRHNPQTAERMIGALLRGVSTRQYEEVLPEMAATVGVSRSSISRQAIEGSAAQLAELRARRWEAKNLLVIYIDGQRFGAHHVISAVGIDREGMKHVLGIQPGATENAASVKALLTHLRDQGLKTDQKYLFVIDGAKALRAAIDEVFGSDQHVQRCRNHKMRNVVDELPREQHAQVLKVMRAAWKSSDADDGVKRMEQLARFLEHDHEAAARSLREGIAEMFTIQKMQLPPSLYQCLGTTNVIESPQGGVQKRTNNVTRWRTSEMVERWVASAWLLTEKHFRKVVGHKDFWTLSVILGREENPSTAAEKVA